MSTKNKLTKVLGTVLVGGMLISGATMAMAEDGTTQAPTQVAKQMMGKFRGHGPWGGYKGDSNLQQTVLDALVKDGTITQAKADEVKAYVEKQAQAREAARAQRQADKAIKPEKPRVNQIVEDKVLTQEQFDALRAKMRETMQAERQKQLTDKVNALVEAGTINKDQASKVVEELSQTPFERLVKGGTISEVQAEALAQALGHGGGFRK